MSFQELGVSARAGDTLARSGITDPNAVQRGGIPPLMKGRDVVIHAPTGSGKTLAYLLPLIDRLTQSSGSGTRALIVAPTRELATQISTVLKNLRSGLRIAAIFGGVGYGEQLRAARQQPDVVIACPGRLLDILDRRALNLSRVEYLVLDEADEMLDQGFAKDVERIIGLTPAGRQTVLASATVPDWVESMISRHLRTPEIVRVESAAAPDLDHGLLEVRPESKMGTLHQILGRERGQTIVFHRTKHGAKKLARDLSRLGHTTAELQGNLSQNARDRAMASFRAGRSTVLVATNVAARGIDVAEVGLVVNFELPETAEWLTHRIGRTARNGAYGRALTFITPDDGAKWTKLRRQGAPDLARVDVDRLLEKGEWAFRPVVPRSASPTRGNDRQSAPRSYRVRPTSAATPSRPPARPERRQSFPPPSQHSRSHSPARTRFRPRSQER